jgi:hypothetical protein
MTEQSILDELHAIRERLLHESGGTLESLVAQLQREQKASGRTIIEARRIKHHILHHEQRSQPSDTNHESKTKN